MMGEIDSLKALGQALNLLACLALALQVLRGPVHGLAAEGGPWARRLFLLAVLASIGWSAAALSDLWSSKLLTWHLTNQLDQLRYAAWGLFLLHLLQPAAEASAPPWRRASSAGMLVLLAVGVLLSLGGGLAADGITHHGRLGAAVHLAWAVGLLLLVEQVFRSQPEDSRWGAKPLCLGLGAISVYDVYLFSQAMMFGIGDDDVMSARGLVHAAAVPLLWIASNRQAAWLRRFQVSRSAAFYSASLLLTGAYLLFIAGVGYYVRYFGGSWGGALQVALLFLALLGLLVLGLSGAARARLRVFLGKNFFSYRYDYRTEWLRFTAMLSSSGSPQEVGTQVVRGLADMVESPAGGLWFKALGDAAFVQSARWNMPASEAAEPPDSAFCRFMAGREWIIDLTDGSTRAADQPAPPAWLAGVDQAWLVVPLLVGAEMTGFAVLARPRTKVELNWEVRDLLKTAARQAAGFLAQIHAAEALLEARKFDAFNRMSAFVVHDLKNIVTQLSLMLKNAERHRHNPEFQQDMLLTVESSLDKMRQLMLQLREGAKPTGTAAGVDLAGILQRIERAAAQRGRRLELALADRIATRGQEERLERVIGHVVQNALDATPASGRVWVTLRQDAGRAVVEVGDTGVGMSQEFIRSRLFRPFSSTKEHGMGIGSYESFQYVKELGGSIDVKSEEGQGSVITILLPLFDQRTATDLRREAAE